MNWSDLLTAIGLAAVIEGVLYAAFPEQMKKAMGEFMAMPIETRRMVALAIAAAGLVIVWFARG